MINDIKLAKAMFDLAPQKRGLYLELMILIGFGAFYLSSGDSEMLYCGMLFISMAPVFVIQYMETFCFAEVVASSEVMKRVQTKILPMVAFVSVLLGFAVDIIVVLVAKNKGIISEETLTSSLIRVVICMLGIMLYLVIALKYFVAGTVFYLLVIACATFVFDGYVKGWLARLNVTFQSAALFCAAALVLTWLLSKVIASVLYAKPIDSINRTRLLSRMVGR